MELGWGALALLIVGICVAWFWQDSLAARERANAAAIRACADMGMQFLDGTVAFARLSLTRAPGGWLTLRRTYVFDYTANDIERRQGFVVMLAHRVETVGYAPGSVPARPVAAATPPVEPSPIEVKQNQDAVHTGETAQVLKLDDWRTRRRRANGQLPRWREDRDDRIK